MEPEVFAIHDRLKVFPPAQMLYITYRRLMEQGLRTTWLWVSDKLWRTVNGVAPARISEVRPGLFVGGQQRKRGLGRMRAMGISAIVNMREESDDTARGVTLDSYLWLPTTDDTSPSLSDMDRGAAFIGEQIGAGHGVYIHCASGVGRAPTMAAAYLITGGLSPAQAWAEILRVRPFVRPTPTQIKIIDEFAAHRAASTRQERIERAFTPFLEDATLTSDLTDDAATVLLAWAENQVSEWVMGTATLDSQTADAVLAPKLQNLRQHVRRVAREASGTADPRAALLHSLESLALPQG